jgi:tetratricopeptide (TPR) repeat protein
MRGIPGAARPSGRLLRPHTARRFRTARAFLPALLGVALGLASCGKKAVREAPGQRPGDIAKVVSHRVVQGETWEGMAEDFYGDPDRAGELARYNRFDPAVPPSKGDLIQVPLSVRDISSVRERKRARRPYNEGLDLAARRQWVEAAARFKEALDLDPDLADARYNLALTYQKMGYHERALLELLGLPEERRETALVHYARGSSLFYLERYADAKDAFTLALDLDPGFLKAQYSLAVTFEKLGDARGAAREWRRYLELDSTGEWAEQARRHLADLESP